MSDDDHRCPSCTDHEDVARLFLNPDDPVQRAWLYDQAERGKYYVRRNRLGRWHSVDPIRETA